MTYPVSPFIFQGKPVIFVFLPSMVPTKNHLLENDNSVPSAFGSPFEPWRLEEGGPPKEVIVNRSGRPKKREGQYFLSWQPTLSAIVLKVVLGGGHPGLHSCHQTSPQPLWESQRLFWELPPEWAGDDRLALLETALIVSPVNTTWGLTQEEQMGS